MMSSCRTILLILSLSLAVLAFASAAEPEPIYPTSVAPGDEDFVCGPESQTPSDNGKDLYITNVTVPTLTAMPADPSSPSPNAIVVMPGGGYAMLSYIKEGEAICDFLNTLDIDCFLLKYRVPARPDQDGMPWSWAPLQDIQRR